MLLLLMASIFTQQEEVPHPFRNYFMKADKNHHERIEGLERILSRLRTQLEIESNGRTQKAVQKQIQLAEKQLEAANEQPRIATLFRPQKNEIGMLADGTVTAVIDDNTVLILIQPNSYVLITQTETKNLRKRKAFLSKSTWQVTSLKPTSKEVQQLIPESKGAYYEVVPVDEDLLAKFRERYDASRKD